MDGMMGVVALGVGGIDDVDVSADGKKGGKEVHPASNTVANSRKAGEKGE